jgi:hypothetical protein
MEPATRDDFKRKKIQMQIPSKGKTTFDGSMKMVQTRSQTT